MRRNIEFDMIIRGIVATRGEEGATIAEMRDDYFDITCERWPLACSYLNQIVRYLTQIDGLVMVRNEDGPYIWYIDDLGNVSERLNQQDSNNNDVIVISDVSGIESVTVTTDSSYTLTAAPRVQPAHLASSSLNSFQQSASTAPTASSDSLLIASLDENRKRNLSSDLSSENFQDLGKRARLESPSRLPLIHENLEIHNRKNGTAVKPQKTTSTEVEGPPSIPNGFKDFPNGFEAPVNGNGVQDLNKHFNLQCRINDSQTTESVSIASTKSTNSVKKQCDICLLGDDFMRLLISYELFQTDYTDKRDDRFSYCLRGQSIRQAFTLILDKQNMFKSRYKYVLINLGAVDILLGRDLIDIKAEFARLIKAIEMIGLKPIITTLPPIRVSENNPNVKQTYQMLLLFNDFLMSHYHERHILIDLCTVFIHAKRENPNKYYLNVTHFMNVNGRKLEIWPWNHDGRQTILEIIDEYIVADTMKQTAQLIIID